MVYPEPCVFWTFDAAILKPDDPKVTTPPVIVEIPSDTGDDCHRNIHHLTPGRAKSILNKHSDPPEEHLVMCVNGKAQPFDWVVLESAVPRP